MELQLAHLPVAKTGRLIRKPADMAYEAFVEVKVLDSVKRVLLHWGVDEQPATYCPCIGLTNQCKTGNLIMEKYKEGINLVNIHPEERKK